MEIDIDTALQFAIETLLVELRRPETESVLGPVFDHYQVTPQERAMILRHIHTLSPFTRLFGHYRRSVETDAEVRREITAEAVTALRELQAQRYKLRQVTNRLDKATQPLPPLPPPTGGPMPPTGGALAVPPTGEGDPKS